MEVILALALGFLLGLGAGALWVARSFLRQRQARGAASAFARLWPDTLPSRSAADILAGRVRVFLGGQVYDLPVLPRAASRRWLETLDGRFATLAKELDGAGDDAPRILSRLAAETDGLYDMLLSYDGSGVLPTRETIDEFATDTQILRAVLEVWRAAHPLAATLADKRQDEPPTSGMPSAPPSGPLPPSAGPSSISMPIPTSSSSPTSTPATSASTRTSVSRSRSRGSASSSPTTSTPTGSSSDAADPAKPSGRVPSRARPSNQPS